MANSVQRLSKTSQGKSTQTFPSYQKTANPPAPLPTESTGSQSSRQSKGLSAFWRGLLWGTAFTMTAAISATVGATLMLVSPVSLNFNRLLPTATLPWGNSSSQEKGWGAFLGYQIARPVNILVMGVDRVPDFPLGSPESLAGRSDTMLLLRFDPGDNSVRMLSLPRDSRVEIPGVGNSKINDANVRGGPPLAAQVVSKTLNDIPIDRYVRVTTDAFRELIDLVGGVEVFVPYPMSYEDKTQKLNINLEAGWQTLNGDRAEQFARFRKDQYGDIGRVQRQQILLKALQKRLYSPAILPRLPQALSILQQYIDTNLSLEEILALANFGRQLQRDKVQMVMLPGRFSKPEEFDGRSYWIINSRERDRVMKEYFGVETTIMEITPPHSFEHLRIAIQNATDEPSLTAEIVKYLAQQGFPNVYLMPEASQLLGETEIVVQKGDLEAANNLKTVLNFGRIEASSTGDIQSDLTIRLGMDAKDKLKNLYPPQSALEQAPAEINH